MLKNTQAIQGARRTADARACACMAIAFLTLAKKTTTKTTFGV